MRMNPKTARRLLLIVAVVVLVVASLVGVFVVRTWQINRRAAAQRAQGLAHFQKHEYGRALDKLGPYLRLQAHQTDREVLIVYGKAREAIEESNLRHIREAIVVYRSAFELDPTDRETGLTLLRHYNTIGFGPEARDLAIRLRPANLADTTLRDLDAMRGEVSARITLKAYDTTLDQLLERIIALVPDDFGAHLTRISVLRESGRSPEAVAHTRQIAEKFPADPRFQFLAAVARVDDAAPGAGSVDAFFESLCELSGLDPETAQRRAPASYTDPIFVARLVGSFDALFRYSHSLAVLGEASGRIADPDLLRAYVRRAWQAGRYRDVADRLASADTSSAGTHSELLAFKAMSLAQLGLAEEVAAIAEALKHRGEDFRARAWALALEHFTDSSDQGRVLAVRALQSAQREDPAEPTFAFLLGEALIALDRAEEAREQWQLAIASPLSRGWALPHSRNSATLVGQGRLDEALKAAERGRQIAPGNPASNIAVLGAKLAKIEAGQRLPEDANSLLEQVERSAAQIDRSADRDDARGLREVLIPGRVLLLAHLGKTKAAVAAITEEVARTPPSDPSVLAHLALISARFKLGFEYECLDLAQKMSPQDPSLGLTRALLLHGEGKGAEGLGSITESADRSDPARRKAWQIAVARYLDASDGGQTALRNWIELADANSEDLQIQLAALGSRSASGDLDFVERLVQRAARLSGTDSLRPTITGRLARARAMLASAMTVAKRDSVLSLVRSMVNEVPDLLEPRRLLVRTLLLDLPGEGIKPDFPAALEQLRAIALAVPGQASTSLEIARLYQRLRDPSHAAEELGRLLSDPSAPSVDRERAIAMLIAQRDYAAAVAPLQTMVSVAGANATPAPLLMLGRALRGLHRSDEALAVYRRLAAMPLPDGAHVAEVADGLAACRDGAGAASLLATLDALGLAPGEAESVRGRFAGRYGDPSAASVLLEKSVERSPKNAGFWQELVAFHMSRRDFAKAKEAMDRAIKSVPENSELAVLQEQVAIGAAGDDASLASLIGALSKSPGNADRVAAMRAVEDARVGGRLDDAKSLAELAGKFPADAGVQAVVLRAYLGLRPPRLDLASELALRATAEFPDSPGLLRLAVATFRGAEDWPRMLAAATEWERVSGSMEAQTAVAEAELRGGQPARAAGTLLPLMDAAKVSPDDAMNANVLELFARALIESDREADAFAVLSPVLAQSAVVRNRVWPGLLASSAKPGTVAEKWARFALQAVKKDDAPALTVIAGACVDAAQRVPDRKKELLELAQSVLVPLAADPKASAGTLERLGLAQQLLGDATAAASSYHRALGLDPRSSLAISNLTDLAIGRGSGIDEALAFAQKAIEAAGPADATLLFSLAKLQTAKAERAPKGGPGEGREWLARSLRNYEAALTLMPDQFEIALRAADIHGRLGGHAAALGLFDRALRSPRLAPDVRAVTQNNAAFALLQLNRDATDLLRARDLARSAVKTRENAAFLDTLGQVELARGERSEAKAAFRRAIALEPKLGTSLLGLAAALDGKVPAERAEASEVLSRAESLLRDRPDEYSAAEQAAIKSLRAKLAEVN